MWLYRTPEEHDQRGRQMGKRTPQLDTPQQEYSDGVVKASHSDHMSRIHHSYEKVSLRIRSDSSLKKGRNKSTSSTSPPSHPSNVQRRISPHIWPKQFHRHISDSLTDNHQFQVTCPPNYPQPLTSSTIARLKNRHHRAHEAEV